jgi:hypothetical protein
MALSLLGGVEKPLGTPTVTVAVLPAAAVELAIRLIGDRLLIPPVKVRLVGLLLQLPIGVTSELQSCKVLAGVPELAIEIGTATL